MTKIARLIARLNREAREARDRVRVDGRKLKRALKAAPKNRLSAWAGSTVAVGRCAVCGVGNVQRMNPDGTPRKNKRGGPIIAWLHAHHLLPKERYPEFKFEPVNGVALCPSHHKFGRYSAHRNPIWFVVWLRRHRPEQYAWAKAHMGEHP